MGNLTAISDLHFVKGIDPVADALAETVYTDIIEVGGEGIAFLIYKGVGASGISTITVEACSTIAAAATSAVPFWYKVVSTTDSGWTAAASTGFSTNASSSELYLVAAPADVFASTGYKYARLKAVESTDSAVLAGIVGIVYGLRYNPQPASLID